jgi:hypothetical protein
MVKKGLKYIASIIGLASVLLFCVSSSANYPNPFDFLGTYLKDPVDVTVFVFVLIGLMSFITKFTSDIRSWLSTGLKTKDSL